MGHDYVLKENEIMESKTSDKDWITPSVTGPEPTFTPCTVDESAKEEVCLSCGKTVYDGKHNRTGDFSNVNETLGLSAEQRKWWEAQTKLAVSNALKDQSAKYSHVEDPNYVEPRTVTTTTSTFHRSTSCTLCGFTGSPKEFADHNCFANPDDPEPNRFDPFEALDTILERAGDIEEQNHETPDAMACIGRLADIRGEVHALRAYITGMDHG